MIGALLSPIFGMVGSLASAGGSLAAAGAKMAYKAVAGSADAVDDAVDKKGFGFKKGKGDADSGEGKGKKGKKGKKESSSMFGGLDLGAVESAIQGPMGPPEPEQEVKGGVYKQIFAVNEKMLSSLMNIENSIRMLLSIEYEKIQGMMSDDRQTTIDEGETDDKVGEKKKGLLGRAASGVGGMLGSAYSKAKGGLGSNLFKALGIAALIVAFKKYPDEIREGVKSLLVFFKETYDYFAADDFTFKKFKTDFIDIFFPKMKGILMGALDFLFNAIKGIASEYFLGAKGDKLIKQQQVKRERSVEALAGMGDLVAKSAGATGKMSFVGGKVAFQKKGLEALGFTDFNFAGEIMPDSSQYAEYTAFQNALTDAVTAMGEITGATDGRIQFLGLPDMSDISKVSAGLKDGSISVDEILNAVPIIDGRISTMEEMKDFGLNKSAGTSKEMNEDNVKQIKKNLGEMTSLTQMMQSIKGMVDIDGNEIGEFEMNGEIYTLASAKERYLTLDAENKIFGQLSPEEVLEMTKPAGSMVESTTGVSESTKSLMSAAEIAEKVAQDAAAAAQDAARGSNSGGNMTTLNSTNDMSSNQQIFHSLNGNPTNGTVMANRARELAAR